MRWVKIIGLAGIVGIVATTSVRRVRSRRAWVEVEPDALRAHLHERMRRADAADPARPSS